MSEGLQPAFDDSEVEIFDFTPKRRKVTLTAKWWMRPICWLLGKPTTRTVMW